nr:MAG TPA: Receptor tyrosine-protein kinase erbB-2, ErbB2, Tyrosine kinase, Activation [Bacteriophage sp.]
MFRRVVFVVWYYWECQKKRHKKRSRKNEQGC